MVAPTVATGAAARHERGPGVALSNYDPTTSGPSALGEKPSRQLETQLRVVHMGFLVIFAAVFVFVLFIVLINDVPRRVRRARRKRTGAEREQLARARQWTFTPTDPSYVNRWRGDPFSRPGSRREAHNVLSGTANGAAFAIFDYQRIHSVQRGASVSFETVTVWAVQIPAALPRLELLRKRGALFLPRKDERVATAHPELDRRYIVTADSPQVATHLVTAEVAGLILEYDLGSFVVEGQIAACCRPPERGSGGTEQIETTLEQLLTLASRLPISA